MSDRESTTATETRNEDPTLFDETALKFVIEDFGKEVDDAGYIVESDGSAVMAHDGEAIRFKNVGGIVRGENGEPLLIRDDHECVMEWVSGKYEAGTPSEGREYF